MFLKCKNKFWPLIVSCETENSVAPKQAPEETNKLPSCLYHYCHLVCANIWINPCFLPSSLYSFQIPHDQSWDYRRVFLLLLNCLWKNKKRVCVSLLILVLELWRWQEGLLGRLVWPRRGQSSIKGESPVL